MSRVHFYSTFSITSGAIVVTANLELVSQGFLVYPVVVDHAAGHTDVP